MRVLFIPSDNRPTSGAFLSMVTLIKLLRDHFGVIPYVVLPCEGKGHVLLDDENIPYEYVYSHDWVVPQKIHGTRKCTLDSYKKRFLNIKAANKIAQIAKREGSELIHLNTTYAYIGALAAKKAGLPHIWHLREFLEEDQENTLWDRESGNKLIAQADKVIAISTSVYAKYKDIIPAEKLVTIFNGIDCDKFYRPEKEIYQNEKFILIYGGGYAHKKGVYELSSALQLLVEMGITNFEIWFLGWLYPEYRAHIRKCGLAPYSKSLGYQKDVAQWYEKADIAFSCSAAEAFGRKTVEAMLCGTLMIASDTCGTLDIIKDKESGLLYQQGDPIDLAMKILYAMSHKEECQKIANAGRDFAYNHFSAMKNAAEVFQQYCQVLKK